MKYSLIQAATALLLSLVLGAWSVRAAPTTAQPAAAAPLAASGTVEADSVRVTTQVAGRIESMPVDEGDEVQSGQVVAHLDDVLLQSQLKQAQAALAGAQAQLAQVKAGPRDVDVQRAQAALALAAVVRDSAIIASEDARAARDNPQDLNVKIAAMQTQVAIAEQKVAQADAAAEAARIDNDNWGRLMALVSKQHQVCAPNGQCQDFGADPGTINNTAYQWNLSSQKLASAWDALGIARAGYDSVKAGLMNLQAQAANPLSANAQVNLAGGQWQAAEAGVKSAEAALALAKAGATPEQVAVAQMGVRQAEAAVSAIQAQIDKTTLRAPIGGIVTARSLSEGEMAAPGISLLTLADLDHVRLTLYIPETDIARIKTGQSVAVKVDSFPERAFTGKISFISPQAEFTPRNTQTAEERAKLVFAVKVDITNTDHALKPGMYADATIQE
jgi:multidrug resistance efflux pump